MTLRKWCWVKRDQIVTLNQNQQIIQLFNIIEIWEYMGPGQVAKLSTSGGWQPC